MLVGFMLGSTVPDRMRVVSIESSLETARQNNARHVPRFSMNGWSSDARGKVKKENALYLHVVFVCTIDGLLFVIVTENSFYCKRP